MEPEIKKILVPIDFSDYSKNSLKYSVNFAKSFNASLILVYVVEPVIYPPDFSMGQIAIPAAGLEMDKRAKEEMDNILFGSTAEKVVRKAPCPVLTLREPAKGFRFKEAMKTE
jgi:nucleotide-binding universal stress UspA family protein